MSSVVAASFNTSVGGYLQSFLDQNSSSTTATSTGLFGDLQSSGSTNTSSSVFGLLQSSATSGAQATETALSTGGLKTSQQKVIAAIAASPNGVLTQAWNANGTEPSTLTTLRNYGWVKLTGKTYNAATKTYQGTYTLTAVGNAINLRTNGGVAGTTASTALSSSTLSGTSSSTAAGATALTSSQSAAIVSILTSLGLATTTSSSSVGSIPTTSSSSSSTGTVLNVLA